LDSHSGQEVIELLEELNTEGITLIMVTHDANMGRRARRRLWMQDGKLLKDEQDARP
jgi:putative ABC transport system ATP-binding protein